MCSRYIKTHLTFELETLSIFQPIAEYGMFKKKGNCAVRVCISAFVSDNSVCVCVPKCEVDA